MQGAFLVTCSDKYFSLFKVKYINGGFQNIRLYAESFHFFFGHKNSKITD